MSATAQTEAVPRDHVVHFYDSHTDLTEAVVPFLAVGLHGGATAIVIATEEHYRSLEAGLGQLGVDLPAARDRGMLVWLEASTILKRIMFEGRIDAEAFEREIGAVLRAATEANSIRAYGELVDLLWQRGDVPAVIELERLWNELIDELHFPLLCAYRGSGMLDPGYQEAIHMFCELHSSTSSARRVPDHYAARNGEPGLEVSRSFAPDHRAPGAARRLLEDALRQWGRMSLLDDARLVLSELVTNAVLHAKSPFSVSVRPESSGVRVAVHDQSPAQPRAAVRDRMGSASGLELVSALASSWGIERVGRGKVVWATLKPAAAGVSRT